MMPLDQNITLHKLNGFALHVEDHTLKIAGRKFKIAIGALNICKT